MSKTQPLTNACTPGPWATANSGGTISRNVYGKDQELVATVCRPYDDENTANALLIAAALDLQHAAQWALDMLDGKHMGANTSDILRAALDKSYGRE